MSRSFSSSPQNILSPLLSSLAATLLCLSCAYAYASEGEPKPEAGGEVAPREKIVLKLTLTDPTNAVVTELRQAVQTGERLELALADGASLTVETSEGKDGRVHLGLAYSSPDAADEVSTERDCELPGEVKWVPTEGAPLVRVSVRPHHKIKLVLDGDPLA